MLIEEAITGREVECAVLGNADPQPSPLGEITPHAEFYTYEAKYADDSTELIVPAGLDASDRARAYRTAPCARSAPSTAPAWRASTSS